MAAVGFAALAICAQAIPPLPIIPAATFDVTKYGAVGDGVFDNTTAIQAALDAARAAGGGTVRIPAAAQPFTTGPLTINSNTNFQVDSGAIVQALPFGTYPKSTTSPAHFITINTGATNVKISGAGAIDGNGAAWWGAYNAGTITSRPRLIQVNRADTVLITGVTLTNAAMFHLAFSASNNVTVDGVTITAPATSPNTDAIDPAGSHYLIQHCNISVGDDNIAVKPGSGFCSDIVINNCTFGTGHGVSVGGQTNLGLDGMTVSNCTFTGTVSGLRLKADPTQGGPVRNITYTNLTMTGVQYPIVFYSYYDQVGTPGATSGSNQTTPAKVAAYNATPPDSLKSSTISTWQNITINGLTATGATGYSIIWGLPLATALFGNVSLNNVSISGTGNYGLEIYNAQNVQLSGSTNISQYITYNALAIVTPPRSQTVAPGTSASFEVIVVGSSGLSSIPPGFQWSFNGVNLVDGVQADGTSVSGARTAALKLSNVQATHAGSYTVAVSNTLDTFDSTITALVANNTAVAATSPAAVLTVGSPTLQFTRAPQAQQLAPGNTAMFTVAASGTGTLTYQWFFNGTAIAGATSSNYTVPNVQYSNSGDYRVNVTDANGSLATSPVALLVAGSATAGASQLHALATRGQVGTGGNILIPGIVVGGSGAVRVVIRATGPGLVGVNIPLARPQLQLFQVGASQPIAQNSGWDTGGDSAALSSAFSAAGLPLFSGGSPNSALLATLTAGLNYTVQVSGLGTAPIGVALVEVYDLGGGTARMTALATRAAVGVGDNILIPGIVVTGTSPKQLLLRGSGPALANLGVTGTLAQPHLEVYNGSVKIAENAGWSNASNPATISAASVVVGLSPFGADSADCAVLGTFAPGAYTALLSGVNNSSGVGLIEVYEVP